MTLERNTASQKLELFAFDYATGAPKTGDAANLAAYVSIDDGVLTALTDTSATEISSTNAPGWYRFDLTQAETDGKKLHFTGKSSTADVSVVGRVVGTVPAYFSLSALDSSGRGTVGAIAAGAITAAAIATDAIDADAIAASAVSEIQSGLSTLDAAGVRTAVGLASANLDTQLSTIDDFLDTEIAAIKAKTDNLPASPANEATLTTMSATLATIASYIDTEIAAIKAKTDNLPADPADASDIAASFSALSATLTTIAGYIDTEVAAIKAKTDNLPASPAAVGSPMTLEDGAITAAKIATGAIDADAIATDAVTEIQSGLSTLTAAGVRSALGMASANLDTQLDALPTAAEVATAVQSGTSLVDIATMVTGDGTVNAKFTTTALSNAPSGGGDGSVRLLATPLRSGRSGVVRYIRGTEGVDLRDWVLDANGGRLDLTGYTITASLLEAADETAVFSNQSASLGSAPDEGQVELAWPANSLDTPGQYKLIWTATSGSTVITWITQVVVE